MVSNMTINGATANRDNTPQDTPQPDICLNKISADTLFNTHHGSNVADIPYFDKFTEPTKNIFIKHHNIFAANLSKDRVLKVEPACIVLKPDAKLPQPRGYGRAPPAYWQEEADEIIKNLVD